MRTESEPKQERHGECCDERARGFAEVANMIGGRPLAALRRDELRRSEFREIAQQVGVLRLERPSDIGA